MNKYTIFNLIDWIVYNFPKIFIMIILATLFLLSPTIIKNYNDQQELIENSYNPIYTGTLKDVQIQYTFLSDKTIMFFTDGKLKTYNNLNIDLTIGNNYTIIKSNMTNRERIILGNP